MKQIAQRLEHYLHRLNVPIIFEISFGATIAILIANWMNLQYSASAGITVLLTIQNTRRETVTSTLQRYLVFFLMVLLSALIMRPMGYTTISFGLFLLLFVGISYFFQLQHVVSSNAVLATHFLAAGHMGSPLVVNEFWILTIGAAVGVLINIVIPYQRMPLEQFRDDVEDQMRDLLYAFAKRVDLIGCPEVPLAEAQRGADENNEVDEEEGEPSLQIAKAPASCPIDGLDAEDEEIAQIFAELQVDLDAYHKAATDDMANRYQWDEGYPAMYFAMRTNQVALLQRMWENLTRVTENYALNVTFSNFLRSVADAFHEKNNTERLLKGHRVLEMLYDDSPLPATRTEFENRAHMYVIMQDMRTFLLLKKDFISITENRERAFHWR